MENKYAGISPYNYSFNNPVMWNDLSGSDPGKPPIDGEKLRGPSSYRGENGIIIQEPASVELEKVSVKASGDETSVGIFGGHGLNIWQAAAMQQAANDPEQQASFARSIDRGASIEKAVTYQGVAAVVIPTLAVSAYVGGIAAITSLQTAGAASTATSVSLAGGGSSAGAGVLTLGGGSTGVATLEGISGFGGLTWSEIASGAQIINGAAILANEAATTANAVIAEKAEKESNGRVIYRSMKTDSMGFPLIEESARGLGVRINGDIPVIENWVNPLTGGMSASPDDPNFLPSHRKPVSLGGTGKDPVYFINTSQLPPGLIFVPDSKTHGTIQPAISMPYETYKTLLSSTKYLWNLIGN